MEKKDEVCYETEDNSPIQTFSKKRNVRYVHKKSNERLLLAKKIHAQNEQMSMKEKNQLDDIDMFFKYLALTIKNFPSQGKREAKVKLFAVMVELEEKYSVPENTIHSVQVSGPPPNFHVSPDQQCYQFPASFEESQSTVQSTYSESTSSPFSLYNFDETTP